ncbi:uroporphyrinogen-III C-methyltransferase [Thaumasiovibrio sp. DFM-14]|uniref:uroporphyrinogen-III C-methyltransferase n=1 Tax=Thaumasiovibrio sp. DFM-14 TaxID=3384792 RepID=UPI0039A2B26B
MTDKKTNKNQSPEDSKGEIENNKADQVENKEPTSPAEQSATTEAGSPKETTAPEKEAATEKTETLTKSEDNQSTPPPVAPPAPTKNKGSKSGMVAIALVILLGGGLYYHGHLQAEQQQAEIDALKAQLNSQATTLSNEVSSFSQLSTQLKGSMDDIRQLTDVRINQQEQSLSSLQLAMADIEGRRPNDWLLAEADYLLKMAGRKLWLEHDVNSATLLVQSADVRIAELNDPSLTKVRRALADDITALKSIERIDRDGIALALTSLQQQIEQLPLANAVLPEVNAQPDTSVSADLNDWQDNLKASLRGFSEHFVTYRKRDGSVIPLLAPDQHFYLKENIKSKLETAIKAVYREQNELYSVSLTMAHEWSAAFFDTDNAAVQSYLERLQQLIGQTIEVDYPTSLQAQPMVTDIMNERLRTKVNSINNAEGV